MPNYPGFTAEWRCTRGSRSNEKAWESTCVSPSVNPALPRALFSHCTARGYAFSSSNYCAFPSVSTVLAADIASPRVAVSELSVNAQSPKLTFSQILHLTSAMSPGTRSSPLQTSAAPPPRPHLLPHITPRFQPIFWNRHRIAFMKYGSVHVILHSL